jgi:PfaB family protein
VTSPLNIAIVGIGGIFPGAKDLSAFWRNILKGRSAAREVPADRWLLAASDALAPATAPDRVRSTRACLIDGFRFDPAAFDVEDSLRVLLPRLDPMFQLLLHAGKQAWDSARMANTDRRRVGIIIGNIALPTDSSSAIADEILGPAFEAALRHASGLSIGHETGRRTHPLNRYVAGLPAGVLARVLGLGAGTYTLDAACASSLYALKLACDELTAGRADAMLAGGLSRPDCLYTQMGFSQLKALSPTGRCAPFDAGADGLVVGEGCGIFALKRLDDALSDGDDIHGIVRGVGLSNDIGGNLMLPDSQGQVRAMRAAYEQARWSPADVELIECHGTGTPTGDAVELNSLRQLRGEAGATQACVIGSVKSNVGHLLTGAGAAGLMKVLFSMRDGMLPPTANFERGSPAMGADAGLEVLREPRPWRRRGPGPRRAAISAFGFGGINAHVLIEEWQSPSASPRAVVPAAARPPTAIAIVGMDVRVGPWRSRRAFHERVFGTSDTRSPRPASQAASHGTGPDFKGFFIDEVSVAIGRFAIPPAELRDMLPQQLLMLDVAANAMADAKLDTGAEQRLRTGVFIGIGLDLNTTNFHFRWSMLNKARAWSRENELSLTDAELEAWADQLRDAAGPPLTANRTMGALGGIVASRVARAFHVGGPSFTVSAEEASGLKAVEVAARALQRGEIDSAIVGAVDLAGDIRAAAGQRDSGRRAGDAEHPLSDGAAAVILKRHDDALRDGDRIYAVITGIGGATNGLDEGTGVEEQTILASLRGACDEAGIDLRAVGLIELAGATQAQAVAQGRAIEALVASGPRTLPCAVADVNQAVGHCGAASGLVALARAALGLHHDLLPGAGQVTDAGFSADSLFAPRQPQYWLRDRADGPRRAIIGALSVDGNAAHAVLQEADKAADVLLTARELAVVMASAKGAAKGHAAARVGKVAFVYPGAGNHHIGMCRALAARWPGIPRAQDAENQRLGSQFAHGRFWSARDAGTISHQDVIFGQVCAGTLITDLFARFGVSPDAVIGYSLGETTSLFSTRWWPAESCRDEMLRRMDASSLFTSDLTGRCDAARATWGLGDDETVDWLIGVIAAPPAKVQAAIRGRARAYLLIVNGPNECVIGGDRAAVMTLAGDLRCALHPVEGVTTVHCEVLDAVKDRYRDLHLLPAAVDGARPRPAVYSSAWGRAYEVTRESAADSIVAQARATVDFTKVIEAAYADGVRIFVEVGPGQSCTRMIGAILGQRDHEAMAVCVEGQDEIASVLRTLSRLRELGVNVNTGGPVSEDGHREGPDEPNLKMVCVKVAGGAFAPKGPGVLRPLKTDADQRPIAPAWTGGPQPQGSVGDPNEWIGAAAAIDAVPWSGMVEQAVATQVAHAAAQEAFLRWTAAVMSATGSAMRLQGRMLSAGAVELKRPAAGLLADAGPLAAKEQAAREVAFDRAMCMEFAVGSIGRMLGPQFAPIDAHPTRVRLPDEPLMLCDRIVEVQGEPGSMTRGRCVTEHDILPDAWYLDCGRIPTCIAVEAGQADLFLSGYLGIDFITKGLAVYRLLDAVVTFHGPLPHAGQTIRYDIRINEFFRQGQTYLFRFEFDATVEGRPVLTMRKGCAGFFTEAELAAGQGIVLTSIDKRQLPGTTTGDWGWLAPRPAAVESYNEAQVDALRRGDERSLVDCFGDAFAPLEVARPVGLPRDRMTLVHRVPSLDAAGGRFGLGQIVGEADIHPGDWFLTCHFVDDRVMPGTLMYECCLHTLRILLLRMGWVGETDQVVYEPLPEVPGQLKCRGQVNETTKAVRYEITVKEIGYGERGPKSASSPRKKEDSTPYVIADALMYADGRAVVQMNNMSLRLTGLTKEKLEAMWSDPVPFLSREGGHSSGARIPIPANESQRPAIFDYASIYAFGNGNPSEAFGERYRVFDQERRIARLPRPPYQFLDRIVSIAHCEPWKLAAGGVIEAQYDVPPLGDERAWYFTSNRQRQMPFAVLLEAALQPCGWLAAYLGSALTSVIDLRFRNLGGNATQFLPVTPETGTLTTTIKITRVSQSAGMIIQNFDMSMRCGAGEVYRGDTYFGFFSADALRDQVGIRDARLHRPTAAELARGLGAFDYPDAAPFPDANMRMIERIDTFDARGGPKRLGFIEGSTRVNPGAWYFEAHFYQDPVVPGSLGLESFIQLLKVVAAHRWGASEASRFESPALGARHTWVYRGQVLPSDARVTVQAVVSAIDDARRQVTADGFLSVDGRVIYQMKDFTLRLT